MKRGTIINQRYEVIETIGRGGMGTVLRVRRLIDGAVVALKYCHLTDERSLRRFTREVRTMKELRHPHVVPIYATSPRGRPPYFVMPFAEGSCAGRLAEFAADADTAVNAFLEICEGVQAIHSAGLVHRDLKPDNALILDGRIVVSDLGLVKPIHRQTTVLTETMTIVGTEMYLAPEQRLPGGSRDADQRTDIYQLGKTLYQLLTGHEPVLMDMTRVPSGLAHVIRKATREHPSERYQTVGELIDAVRAYQQAQDPAANPMTAFEGVIGRIRERVERDEYQFSDLQNLLSIMSSPALREAPSQFLELFDQIPHEILEVLAESHSDDLLPVLEAYVMAIDEAIASCAYPYAEVVARKMRIIFSARGATPDVKGVGVEAAVLAAVRLHRFAAMDAVNAMLIAVTEDADAMAVREALDRRRREYGYICKQVPTIKLHPAIRALREELLDQQE